MPLRSTHRSSSRLARHIASALSRALLCGLLLLAPLVQAGEPVKVFAAASLKTALDAIAETYARDSGETLLISYAGSNALAVQIDKGAPADLFISADLDWMRYLSERGLTRKDSERVLLGNRLVLVAPRDSTQQLKIAPGFDLAAALGDGRLALCQDSVPAGKYGQAALKHYGVWERVATRTAPADNVRAALAFVARGETPLGIVYASDAIAEPAVRVVDSFADDSHPPIVYPAAVLKDSRNPQAQTALRYLSSPAAQKIFIAQGFTVLEAVR